MEKLSGDVTLENIQHWQDSNSILKWTYQDPSGMTSQLRARADKLRSGWTGVEPRVGRPMAADGATSGLSLEWEF